MKLTETKLRKIIRKTLIEEAFEKVKDAVEHHRRELELDDEPGSGGNLRWVQSTISDLSQLKDNLEKAKSEVVDETFISSLRQLDADIAKYYLEWTWSEVTELQSRLMDLSDDHMRKIEDDRRKAQRQSMYR